MDPKAGHKTSEFWLHVAAAVGSVLYMTLAASPDIRVALVTQAVAAVYGLGRTYLKTKHLDIADVAPVVSAVQKAAQAVEATPVVPASAPTPVPVPPASAGPKA